MNEFLLNQGLSGVAILGLSYAVLRLYQENQRLHTEHREELQQLIDKIRDTEDKHNQRFLSIITTSATQGEQMLTAIAGINESLSVQKMVGDKLDSTVRRLVANADKNKEIS